MTTLSDWVLSWINISSGSLAPSTVSGYRSLYRRYLTGTPAGCAPLDQIDASQLTVAISAVVGAGYPRAAQLLHVLLHASLADAFRRGILPANPMDRVPRPRHQSRMTRWWSLTDAQQFLAAAHAADDPLLPIWLLAILCGLRRGELLGLMWTDIDTTTGIIHVQRQRIHIDGRDIITTPKTRTSVRDIPISTTLSTELAALRRSSPSPFVAREISARLLAKRHQEACARANVPRIPIHGMRHTFAACAANSDIPIKDVQLLLGHSDFTTTANIYTHVSTDKLRRSMALIDGAYRAPQRSARLEIV